MKYETKNNIGLTCLIIGVIVLVGVMLLSPLNTILSWLVLLASIGTIGYGFYLMTRGFTKADVDHPDYNRHNQHEQP